MLHKLITTAVVLLVASAAHALPSGVESGGTATLSTVATPTYNIPASSTCGVAGVDPVYGSPAIKRNSLGYFYYWANSSTSRGTIDVFGYNTVSFTLNADLTGFSTFGGEDVKLHHDVSVVNWGNPFETIYFDNVTHNKPVTKEWTSKGGQVSFRAADMALSAATGFKTKGTVKTTLTVTCLSK